MKEFKKGDNVVVLLDKMGNTIIEQTTITNITQKGKITTANGYNFDINGLYKPNERFSTTDGLIIPYDEKGKNIIAGKNCIVNMIKMLKNTSNNLVIIYKKIHKDLQYDTEKLESIKAKLNLILNEINNMV